MSDDNFKDHPVSIAEVKSNRSGNASDWSPRDALIYLLRKIDNGENIEHLVIGFRGKDEGGNYHSWVAATPSGVYTLGILSRVTHAVNLEIDGKIL